MPKEFPAYVKDTMSRLKSHYGWTQDGDAFAHFAICHVSLLSEREVYEDVHVGAQHDKSLDGFSIDHDKQQVTLFQSKYQEMTGSFGDRAALSDFIDVLQRMQDEESSKQFKYKEIRRCARRYRDAVKEKYAVILNFIVYGSPTPSVMDDVKVHRTNLPPHHTLEIWGFKRLEERYADLLSFEEPITETIPLMLENIECVNVKTPKAQAVVVTLPALQIYELRKTWGRRLYAKDVRYFLGKTPINKQIAKTLSFPTDRQFFWYYNNGISISCSDYSDIDEETKIINVSKPQIINGCQTAESIFNFAAEEGVHNIENVSVLARIIKTTDPKIGQNVTTRTNTQNPQRARNLCANLSSQQDLKDQFRDLKLPVFYQAKDGEWDSLPGFEADRYIGKDKTARLVDNLDAAQAYIAFVTHDDDLNPVEARRKQSQVFDTLDKYYSKIFPDDVRSPYEYLVPYLFLEYVERRLKKIRQEVDLATAKTEAEAEIDEIKASLRYAKWFIVGLIGSLVRVHYAVETLDADLAKQLYEAIGDFSSPSELGNYMTEFAMQIVEEYSDDHMSHENGEEREEFDPALAYRRIEIWRVLNRKLVRKHTRAVEKGEFRGDLFPPKPT